MTPQPPGEFENVLKRLAALEGQTRSLPRGFVLDHFWKLVAVVVLAGAFYLGFQTLSAISNGFTFLDKSMMEMRDHSVLDHFVLELYGKDKQFRPATVAFKDKSPAVTGYVQDSYKDFLLLSTMYKDESREETILIPWVNILYVKMELKESKPGK